MHPIRRAGAALVRDAAAGVVDQDPAHRSRRGSEEVGAALEVGRVEEAHPGLADERGRLERVVAGLASELGARHLEELAVDTLEEAVLGSLASPGGGLEEVGQRRRIFGRHGKEG